MRFIFSIAFLFSCYFIQADSPLGFFSDEDIRIRDRINQQFPAGNGYDDSHLIGVTPNSASALHYLNKKASETLSYDDPRRWRVVNNHGGYSGTSANVNISAAMNNAYIQHKQRQQEEQRKRQQQERERQIKELRRAQKLQQKQQRDIERANFFERRQEERAEAIRIAQERERRRKEEENRRVMAHYNAKMQQLESGVQQRIARDNWHATTGADMAFNKAAKTSTMRGPQLRDNDATKITSSGADLASSLGKKRRKKAKPSTSYTPSSEAKEKMDAYLLSIFANDSYVDSAFYERTNSLRIINPSQLKNPELASLVTTINQLKNADGDDGFFACIYFDEQHDRYILSFRGSSSPGLNPDWKTNVINQSGFKSPQFDYAQQISAEILKLPPQIRGQIVITGHSLGGGLASFTGALTGCKTTTFNAEGVPYKVLRSYATDLSTKLNIEYTQLNNNIENINNNITAYYSSNDPLSIIQTASTAITANIAPIKSIALLSEAPTTWSKNKKLIVPALGKRINIGITSSPLDGHSMDGVSEKLGNMALEKAREENPLFKSQKMQNKTSISISHSKVLPLRVTLYQPLIAPII